MFNNFNKEFKLKVKNIEENSNKEPCTDHERDTCNVEKMGCDGCNYIDESDTKIDNAYTAYKEHIYNTILKQMHDTYIAKNHDYGDSVSKTFDEYGLTSFLVRMDDKMNRLRTLDKIKDAAVRGEKIEDTLMDLANYAVLAMLEIKFRASLLLSEPEDIEKWMFNKKKKTNEVIVWIIN